MKEQKPKPFFSKAMEENHIVMKFETSYNKPTFYEFWKTSREYFFKWSSTVNI